MQKENPQSSNWTYLEASPFSIEKSFVMGNIRWVSLFLAVACATSMHGATATRKSFCDRCEGNPSRDKPGTACECQAYCCSVGYQFSDTSICSNVLDKDGKSTCDDPCAHCLTDETESSANGATESSCLGSCCESDLISHSCKMWRFNSTLEVSVTGSKHIVLPSRAAAAAQGTRSSSITIEKRLAADIHREGSIGATMAVQNVPKPCSMTSQCNNYCDTYNSPMTPVRSVCSLPSDLNTLVQGTATCAGWGCSEASQEQTEEGCFCCCSSYREAMNEDKCEISSNFGSCIQYCASHRRNLMPLSCPVGSDSSEGCGGATCVERSEDAGSKGCFCCCAE